MCNNQHISKSIYAEFYAYMRTYTPHIRAFWISYMSGFRAYMSGFRAYMCFIVRICVFSEHVYVQ